jgi:hypothetical protein
MENMLLQIPYFRKYKFKKSYGGTPEPQTPSMHPGYTDPLLKKTIPGVKSLICGPWYQIAVKIKPLYLTYNA